MYRPTVSAAPASTIITATEVKAQCRVDFTDDDTLIGNLIDNATSYMDGFYGVLGRAMFTQTWVQKFDGWDAKLYLPVFPVASITSVTYLDTAGATQTVSSALYTLLHNECGAYVQFLNAFTFPTTTTEYLPSVTVTYVAGESAPPKALKQAMLMLVAHWYENRETVGQVGFEVPHAFDMLIAPYRRYKF